LTERALRGTRWYDYAIQGMGGLMSVTGERDDLGGGPQKVAWWPT
jgi:crotonobetainyl-CoA:carnitine CoA-transferase CaiB-like acyl-CoA transferase